MIIINLNELGINTWSFGFDSRKILYIVDEEITNFIMYYFNNDQCYKCFIERNEDGLPCWHYESTGEICSEELSRKLEISSRAEMLLGAMIELVESHG